MSQEKATKNKKIWIYELPNQLKCGFIVNYVDNLFKEDYVFSVIPAGRVGPRSGGYEGILENIKVKYGLYKLKRPRSSWN